MIPAVKIINFPIKPPVGGKPPKEIIKMNKAAAINGERLLIPTYFFMSVEPVANSTWVAAINAPMLAKA